MRSAEPYATSTAQNRHLFLVRSLSFARDPVHGQLSPGCREVGLTRYCQTLKLSTFWTDLPCVGAEVAPGVSSPGDGQAQQVL